DHVGVDGIVVLQTPPEVSQQMLNRELQNVPGFVYVEDYDPDADPVSRRSWFPQSPGREDEDAPIQDVGPDGTLGSDSPGPVTDGAGPAGPLAGPNIVSGLSGFDGINASQSGLYRPPDSDGAVGPSSF